MKSKRFALLVLLLVTGLASTASATDFPDVRPDPPKHLSMTEGNDGTWRLYFTTDVRNDGNGALEVSGDESSEDLVPADQVLYASDGTHSRRRTASFVYHRSHEHFHVQDFATYELWDSAAFDLRYQAPWLKRRVGSDKVSFCLADILPIPGNSAPARYDPTCTAGIQCISPGWIDRYSVALPDQNLVLGDERLSDGVYVLRFVLDPRNQLWESAGGTDASRESVRANESFLRFAVIRGSLVPLCSSC